MYGSTSEGLPFNESFCTGNPWKRLGPESVGGAGGLGPAAWQGIG